MALQNCFELGVDFELGQDCADFGADGGEWDDRMRGDVGGFGKYTAAIATQVEDELFHPFLFKGFHSAHKLFVGGAGEFVQVMITKAYDYDIEGEVV